jgi:hypothetical protein
MGNRSHDRRVKKKERKEGSGGCLMVESLPKMSITVTAVTRTICFASSFTICRNGFHFHVQLVHNYTAV